MGEPSLLLSDTNPPPGTYDIHVLPTGQKVEVSTNRSVLFTKGSVPNFIEDNVRMFKDNPGPGTYQHSQPGLDLDSGCLVLKPPMVKAINQADTYSAPVWA